MRSIAEQIADKLQEILKCGYDEDEIAEEINSEILCSMRDQIESMKCCGNCKHYEPHTKDFCRKEKETTTGNYICGKWEMR